MCVYIYSIYIFSIRRFCYCMCAYSVCSSLQFLLECAQQLPHKIPFYGTLVEYTIFFLCLSFCLVQNLCWCFSIYLNHSKGRFRGRQYNEEGQYLVSEEVGYIPLGVNPYSANYQRIYDLHSTSLDSNIVYIGSLEVLGSLFHWAILIFWSVKRWLLGFGSSIRLGSCLE